MYGATSCRCCAGKKAKNERLLSTTSCSMRRLCCGSCGGPHGRSLFHSGAAAPAPVTAAGENGDTNLYRFFQLGAYAPGLPEYDHEAEKKGGRTATRLSARVARAQLASVLSCCVQRDLGVVFEHSVNPLAGQGCSGGFVLDDEVFGEVVVSVGFIGSSLSGVHSVVRVAESYTLVDGVAALAATSAMTVATLAAPYGILGGGGGFGRVFDGERAAFNRDGGYDASFSCSVALFGGWAALAVAPTVAQAETSYCTAATAATSTTASLVQG